MSGINAMMAGQTINDRLLAARHSIAGQGLAKSVCKATTEEMIAPKKKHLDYLVHCTNEPNVSIPQLATLLVERTQNTNWVVVYKALITVHHLLAYGNERFTQYLASSNSSFQLSNFLDKSGVQGAAGARIGYDMSPFIRRYAKYLNEKALSYRTVAFDFCKVKRGKEEGSLRMMNAEKLLKTLPVLQAQLDGLLEFDCTANDLTNGVINMCFMLLFRDLIRLFACYNDGIINLLEKYFDMNKKNCREALDLYKKFLIRMDRVAEFLKVAENVGIDKGDIPDLTKAPSSLLDALEGHLAAIEGKKGSAANTPTQTASAQKSVANVMGALSSTSSSFGSAAASSRIDKHGEIDDKLKQQVLDEEEAAMNLYKTQANSSYKWMEDDVSYKTERNKQYSSELNLSGDHYSYGAGGSHSSYRYGSQLNLSGSQRSDQYSERKYGSQYNLSGHGYPNTSNDLISYGEENYRSGYNKVSSPTNSAANNPFLSSAPAQKQSIVELFGPESTTTSTNKASDDLLALGNPFADMFGAPTPAPVPASTWSQPTNGFNSGTFPPTNNTFVSDANFSNVFDNTDSSGGQQAPQQPGKVLTGDLDSSLASLANNLTINKTASAQKPMQWNSPKNGSKTAGNTWSPQPMQATTGAGYRPMGHGMPPPPMPHTYHPPHYVMQQPGMVMVMPTAASVLPAMQPLRPAIPPQPATNNNFT